MKVYLRNLHALALLVFTLLFHISCEKDQDLLAEAIAPDAPIEDIGENDGAQENLVSRTVEFSPMEDAYIQNSTGYNQSIVRLEENNRTSYLRFDLSQIKSVEGVITNVKLQFQVETDDGDGTIDVYKGSPVDWTEESLSGANQPDMEISLGSINKTYDVGSTEEVDLDPGNFLAEKTTVIMAHKGGDDLAFASKEHPSKKGPKLLVTYEASADFEAIVPNDTQDSSEIPTIPSNDGQITISADVKYWQDLFDARWEEEYSDALSRSLSGNKNQEYYWLAYYIDGLSSMWQATGDSKYLDTALSLINNTINDANTSSKLLGFLSWLSSDGEEHPLWDSYYWRQVATLLRVMYQSPSIMSNGNYKSQFDTLLAFSEKNIWQRYETDGLWNFYRVNTHMTSHWARIGMELYLMTGNQKYKDVFDKISHGEMIGRPSNLRNQIRTSSQNASAYVWDKDWDATPGSDIQDTSHGGAIAEFIVLAYENNMYWNLNDVMALSKTLDEVIWISPNQEKSAKKFVNGSGDYELPGRLHEWLVLGRYNKNIQEKIRNNYSGKNLTYFGSQALGIAALNAKILSDGKAAYPG